MPRRSQFTVDAESVQGNAGATATFKSLKVREVREYRETEMTDADLLQQHVLSWSGFVDDQGKALPSPADEPGILGELYVHEQLALSRLLFQGPDGPDAKN
jgi:hypothetical protein